MTLWDSKRSLDPPPQSCLNVTLREGREERAESSRGLTSVTRDPGASQKQMGPRREGNREAKHCPGTPFPPYNHRDVGGLQGKKPKQCRVGTCPGSCCNEQQRQDVHTSVSGPGLSLLLALSVSMACEEGQAQKEG